MAPITYTRLERRPYYDNGSNANTHTSTHAYTPTPALDDVTVDPPLPAPTPHSASSHRIPPHTRTTRPPHTRTHREIHVARLPPGLGAAGGEGKA